MTNTKAIRRALLGWYARAARPLPWRATRDPYHIWVSEIMLQQTRAAAVAPYYERFLARFPDVRALARAGEPDVLACWGGLGYYARARNLHEAARRIAAAGEFPRDYAGLRALPGVGEYTAAAVASIAFGLPHAAVDGNVRRVLARLANGQDEPAAVAGQLLDQARPGDFNQALMELGATVCLPREPRCDGCPLARHCLGRRLGTAHLLPAPKPRKQAIRVEQTLLLIRRGQRLLLYRHGGFWELPAAEQLPQAEPGAAVARLRHTVMNRRYRITVVAATLRRAPAGFEWVSPSDGVPLSTVVKKLLRT